MVRALTSHETNAEKKIKQHFRQMTGKRHVLITNSCRTALFLAYCALGIKGEVITSPLTCKVAIHPITESGNIPIFADVRLGDLCIQPEDITNRVTRKTIAIQAIHLGGVSCEMDKIVSKARENNLMVIEDCAQSLGALFKGRQCGTYGDIACFSLIKNAYGIGGGIFATNNTAIFRKARSMNKKFATSVRRITIFRVIRNFLDTNRSHRFGAMLFKFLMVVKGQRTGYESVKAQLRQIGTYQLKIAARQMKRWPLLHQQRKTTGKHLYNKLISENIMDNRNFCVEDSSFTKFFVYHPLINSRKFIDFLNSKEINAMHLEQKFGSPVQDRLVSKAQCLEKGLYNYNTIHDHLISLPLFEQMSDSCIKKIVNTMKRTMKI